MPLTQETFATLVLEDTDGRWELHRQKLREKPAMSFGHNHVARNLARQLLRQLPEDGLDILQNAGHLALTNGDAYIPDLAIVPVQLTSAFRQQPRRFESYADPLPFVVEIWSPSTGSYDIDAKIPGYRQRGDQEIWRVHPFDQTVASWRRQPDGSYAESEHREGKLALHALPSVTIDLDRLFA